MTATFLVQIRTTLHRPAVMFWALAFPIILAALFSMMFGSLGESYTLRTQPLDVVRDDGWSALAGVDGLVAALADGDDALVETTDVDTVEQAVADVRAGRAVGYCHATDDGRLELAVGEGTDEAAGLTLSVLDAVVTRYNETLALGAATARDDPQALLDQAFVDGLGSTEGLTEETRVTRSGPDETSRYYFALLGMACLMTMSIAIGIVNDSQPNLSALGARRSVAPLPKWRMLLAGFLAAWLLSFLCMTVAFLAMRFVFGVTVGGREPLAVMAVAVSTLMASAFGSALGAIPRLSEGSKTGIATGITCLLSLFAGLYGEPAMRLSDLIQREAPLLADINPAQQVTTLFYDLLYYTDLGPFARTVGVLVAMSALFLAVAAALLRRQRYEHL